VVASINEIGHTLGKRTIGECMTGMPEAGLARELGLDYACLAVVANWAAGCGSAPGAPAEEITLEEVLANVEAATATLPSLLSALVEP